MSGCGEGARPSNGRRGESGAAGRGAGAVRRSVGGGEEAGRQRRTRAFAGAAGWPRLEVADLRAGLGARRCQEAGRLQRGAARAGGRWQGRRDGAAAQDPSVRRRCRVAEAGSGGSEGRNGRGRRGRGGRRSGAARGALGRAGGGRAARQEGQGTCVCVPPLGCLFSFFLWRGVCECVSTLEPGVVWARE